MIRKISLIAKDRVGLLSDITYILAKEKINIEEIDAQAIEGERAVIIIGVESAKYEKAREALARNGYDPLPENSFIIAIRDQPGELAKVSTALKERQINIIKVATVGKHPEENVMLIEIMVDKPREARRILQEYVVSEYNE